MTQLVDKVTLGENNGPNWNEVNLGRLTATSITETTESTNPQQVADSLLTMSPTMVEVHTVILDRMERQAAKAVIGKIGGLAQNAIQRKKDIDGLVALDAGTVLSTLGAGTTLSSGMIAAQATRIRSNTTEPWDGPVVAVLHGFQVKDLFDELTAAVGTYDISKGQTAEVFQNGFELKIANTMVVTDDNITIDSSDDAKGGTFARGKGGALVLVQGKSPWIVNVRNEKLGGGANEVLHRDEYIYGERTAGGTAGVHLYETYSDATAPT